MSKDFRSALFLSLLKRPLELHLISLEENKKRKTGEWLKEANYIEQIIEDNNETDEETAQKYGLW